jgi:hypothetical protein
MASEPQHLAVQAARVLDHLQTLRDCYGEDINQSEPELAQAIDHAISALDSFVSRTVSVCDDSKS